MRKPSFAAWLRQLDYEDRVRVLDYGTGRSYRGEVIIASKEFVHIETDRLSLHIDWPHRRHIVINNDDSVTILCHRDLFDLPHPLPIGAPRYRIVRYR